MTASEVRIALIGSGKMAAVHAHNIANVSGARLVAVAGGSGAASLADRYGAKTLDVEEAFARDDIDAVVIASPNRFHADHIVAAAAGGKGVLVEKPVDLDLDRVDECIRQVGVEAAKRIVVAFNRRFDLSFATLHERVWHGQIGELSQLTIISRDPAPPPLDYMAASGGIFRDMTIHDFDMARFIAGDIASVSATVQAIDPDISELDDASGAVVTLTTTTGALVTIINSRSNASGYDQRVEAFGPQGVLSIGNPATTLVRFSDAELVDAAEPYLSHYADRYGQAYRSEIAHLVAVTRGDDIPRATLHDGREALALACAAAESSQSGRTVHLSKRAAPELI